MFKMSALITHSLDKPVRFKIGNETITL